MSARILDGKRIAQELLERVGLRVAAPFLVVGALWEAVARSGACSSRTAC